VTQTNRNKPPHKLWKMNPATRSLEVVKI